MSNIKTVRIGIPGNILDLITKKTPLQSFDAMVNIGSIPLLELQTFGMVITNIFHTETQVIHSQVTLWENNRISITSYKDSALLIALEDWPKSRWPTSGECLDIFNRHVSTTPDGHINESFIGDK